MKYEVIRQFKGITSQMKSLTVHLNDSLSKNEPNVMETSGKLQPSVHILRKRPQIKQDNSQMTRNLDYNLALA